MKLSGSPIKMTMPDRRKAPMILKRNQNFPFLGTKNTPTDFKQKNVATGMKAHESMGRKGRSCRVMGECGKSMFKVLSS